MKKKILIVGLAALAWGVLYALGIVDLGDLIFCPVFGAINYVDYYKAGNAKTHRGGYMRWMQVDPVDGGVWAGASDWMGNDAGSIYGNGEMIDIEVFDNVTSQAFRNNHGKIYGHSLSSEGPSVSFSMAGLITKYTTLGAGSGVYYSDQSFNSGMDGIHFRVAVYLANDTPNEGVTNGAYLKYTFWCGQFIIESLGAKASDSGPRVQVGRFLPISLSNKTDLGFRNGGQIYTRKSVATLQALSSAETWDSEAEVTVN